MTEPSRAPVRIEQPADPADVRAVGYGPRDVPQVPERYAGLKVYKETSGRRGISWSPELMDPRPETVYVVDERYVYVTDRVGRVVHAEGWLGWSPTSEKDRRNLDAQLEAGEPDRQAQDDGGHLFATKFEGPGESVNLTAQSRSQNRLVKGSENWRRMEESWQALRAAGTQVHAAIDVKHPDGKTRRPSSRTVVDRHDGKASARRIFRETKPLPNRGHG